MCSRSAASRSGRSPRERVGKDKTAFKRMIIGKNDIILRYKEWNSIITYIRIQI